MEKEFKVQVKETPTVELEVEAPKTIQPKVTVSSVTQPVENKTVEEPKATELPKEAKVYELPSIDLLDDYPESDEIDAGNEKDIKELIPILIRKLDAFGIHTEAAGYIVGPTYSRIELNVLSNVQVKKIASIQQDLEMALKRKIRPLLPIKGKNLIGIEVENARRNIVGLKETMLQKEPSDNVDFIVGEDIEGKIISMNFKELPHMLVGGSPGAGKTVFLHSIITSLLLRYSPDEVKLALIDFKRVEFNYYRDLPHLLSNRLIDEYSDAYELLEELAKEMNRRYDLFYNAKVSDIDEYNKIATVRLPQIILVIDEYADMCGSEYKDRIQNVFIRLAQKARASGIHLIVATQRPSVSVISGVLKANLPTRVSFLVPTHVDSCNILDVSGAQSLTGKGDMLFGRIGSIERIQAPYISVDEIKRVVDFIKKQ